MYYKDPKRVQTGKSALENPDLENSVNWMSLSLWTWRLTEAFHSNTDSLLLKQACIFFFFLPGEWLLTFRIWMTWNSKSTAISQGKSITYGFGPKSAIKSKLWNRLSGHVGATRWLYIQLPPFLYPMVGTNVCGLHRYNWYHMFKGITTFLQAIPKAMKTALCNPWGYSWITFRYLALHALCVTCFTNFPPSGMYSHPMYRLFILHKDWWQLKKAEKASCHQQVNGETGT